LQSSLKLNFYFYTFLCFVGVIAFVFLLIARELTLATLPSFIIALSNALGLVAITLFLGYGLVEVRYSCCASRCQQQYVRSYVYGLHKANWIQRLW